MVTGRARYITVLLIAIALYVSMCTSPEKFYRKMLKITFIYGIKMIL
jgi:hypothetical protein